MTRGIAVGWSDLPAGPGRRLSAWLLDEDSFSPADAALEASSLGASSLGDEVCVSAGLVLMLDGCWSGPGVSAADVLAATTGVIGALELRRGDRDGPDGPLGPPARLVLGPTVADPVGLDLGLIGLLLEVGGVQVATAAGAAALGHPATAAAEGLTVACRDQGAGIGSDPDGELVVYTGRLTPLFPLRAPGHARAAFGHLGSVGVRVT